MKFIRSHRRAPFPVAFVFAYLTALASASFAAPSAAPRTPDDDVNNPALRVRAGLLPGANLLFNGWGVTPAGTHTRISDMALKMVISPDKKRLVAVSGGFSDTGLTLYDLATQKVTQFLPLKESFNGLVFSRDGRRILVSGGDTGLVHVFDYADGKATPATPVAPASVAGAVPSVTDAGPIFLAGLAMHPSTGRI
jgi:WD40 repeat protein